MFIEDAHWGLWGEWEPCPATCGGAYQNRHRVCNVADSNNKDDQCEGDQSSRVQSRRCGDTPCLDSPGNEIRKNYCTL